MKVLQQTVSTISRVGLGSWPKVVLLGDSHTQFSFSQEGCWGSLLAARLQRKCDVVNRGFSNYNSTWLRVVLPRLLDESSADEVVGVTICVGTNDSHTQQSHRRHVPPDRYQDNLFHMVDYLKSVGISERMIVMITPPACDEQAYTHDCNKAGRLMTKSEDLVGLYSAACKYVAHECGTRFVNLHGEMLRCKEWRSLLTDGVHLSRSGSVLLDSLVGPHLEEMTSHLPVILPTYRQVDISDLDTSFLGGNRSKRKAASN